MSIIELLILAIGLSMDAFAVSISQGLSMQKITLKKALIVGLYFGVFQALMPIIGYFLGIQFADSIMSLDHWVAFVLLGFIGAKMIRESRQKDEKEIKEDLGFRKMIIMAIATSIDALAIGITLAFLNENIYLSSTIIGIVTLVVCMVGVKLGNVFGVKYKSRAEFVGGVILVLMGVKILLEHLGVLK